MMRQYLQEGDLISAEVQSVYSDGSLSLHTRSFRYGKVTVTWFTHKMLYSEFVAFSRSFGESFPIIDKKKQNTYSQFTSWR